MDAIKSAIAAAYADAAFILAHAEDEEDDRYTQAMLRDAHDAILARAAAVAAKPALIGVAPWSPPEDDFVQCLGWVGDEWLHVVRIDSIWRWVSDDGDIVRPTAFHPLPAPLPAVKGAQDE